MKLSKEDRSSAHPVVILANGASKRFGRPKSEARLGEKTLIEWVFERMRSQTNAPILINANAPIKTAPDAPYLPDLLGPSLGPLAGIHAAVKWATSQGYEAVATVSVDTPFLPLLLLQRFEQATAPCFASCGGRSHPTIGLWMADSGELLEEQLAIGNRSVHGWLETCRAKKVDFELEGEIDPFININTTEDLARAAAYLLAS
ncbi:MAG: molybdenum cofactor guanylyltransferase [Pseudomonadota bacterium]